LLKSILIIVGLCSLLYLNSIESCIYSNTSKCDSKVIILFINMIETFEKSGKFSETKEI